MIPDSRKSEQDLEMRGICSSLFHRRAIDVDLGEQSLLEVGESKSGLKRCKMQCNTKDGQKGQKLCGRRCTD